MSRTQSPDDSIPRPRIAPWRHMLLPIGAALLLAIFGILADEVTEGDTLSFDMTVLRLFRSAADTNQPIGPGWLQEAVRDLTSLGSVAILAIVTLLVVLTLVLRGLHRT